MPYKQVEKQTVKEIDENIQEFISYSVLVATGVFALNQKKKLINNKFKDIASKNEKIIKKASYELYKAGKTKTYKDIKKSPKRLTTKQKKELDLVTESTQLKAIGLLNGYKMKADTLIVNESLKMYREDGLGMENAQEKFAYGKKLKKNLLFQNSKGQRVKTKGLTRVVVGDSLYSGYVAGQRSTFLDNNIFKVLHVSVLDDRTTPICESLDGTERNLLTDQLPPMHAGCRSTITSLKK